MFRCSQAERSWAHTFQIPYLWAPLLTKLKANNWNTGYIFTSHGLWAKWRLNKPSINLLLKLSSSSSWESSYQGARGGWDYSTYPAPVLCSALQKQGIARDGITTFLHIHTHTLKAVARSLDIAIYPNTLPSPSLSTQPSQIRVENNVWCMLNFCPWFAEHDGKQDNPNGIPQHHWYKKSHLKFWDIYSLETLTSPNSPQRHPHIPMTLKN